MNSLTIRETVEYHGRRARKVYEAAAGNLLVTTKRTASEAKRTAIDEAINVLGNVWRHRAYRYGETSYFVHANANGGYTVESVHDSEELAYGGTCSNSCVVYGPERSFEDVCKTVEQRIEDLRNPTPYALCPTCGYPTFAPNKVDPIPANCQNPACGADLPL